jgi:hypothetical protein
VRKTLYCLALSIALAGSFAQRANAQASDEARAAVTPNLIRECRETLLKEYPQVTIVGKFFLAARRGGGNLIIRLVEPGETVALAAPITKLNVFGSTARSYAGCLYDVKNGTLSFRKLVGGNYFPPRNKLEPGEQ